MSDPTSLPNFPPPADEHPLRGRVLDVLKDLGLNPNIDAIFNGHTHQKYVFNQPVTGGDRPTRPIVQTGQYGENVGQIVTDFDEVSPSESLTVNVIR